MSGIGWAFQNIAVDVMVYDFGWYFSNVAAANNTATNTPADLWTYIGDTATRYSWGVSLNQTIQPPADMQPANGVPYGAWSISYRNAGISGATTNLINHVAAAGIFLRYDLSTLSTTFSLFVSNTIKTTSVSMDTSQFHYFTLKSDMRANPWLGQMWIDGVQVGGTESQANSAQATSYVNMTSGANAGITRPGIFGHMEAWTLWSDPAETVKWGTWIDVNEALATPPTVGTWTPSAGTNITAISGPFNAATYTRNAAPASGDRLDMGTSTGATTTIASLIGVTASTPVYNVTLRTWSQGGGQFAAAVLGDGAAETIGAYHLIDAVNTSGASIALDATPTGPAWTGADAPRGAYRLQ